MTLSAISQPGEPLVNRLCLRVPIPEIDVAADYLDKAASAHLSGEASLAQDYINRANMPAIREWTESLWGKNSPYVQYRPVANVPAVLHSGARSTLRMPTSAEKQLLHSRDGYHCRFCGVPVIRKEVRDRLRRFYPAALPWVNNNALQHAAFQAMWAQYDHILPHARGGNNDLQNIVVTCAPCNYGRMNYTLEEVGLADPRSREPVRSAWDGLERLLRRQASTERITNNGT
jgi:hypothetical protein